MSNDKKIDVVFNPYTAITADIKLTNRSAANRMLINDAFKGDGITPEMFKAIKKDAPANLVHVNHFAALNVAIIASFSAADRKTLNTPTKALQDGNEPGQKGAPPKKKPTDPACAAGTKRYIQQQIGAKRNDYMGSLNTYLNGPKKKGADDKTGDKTDDKTDDKTFCLESLNAIIKRLQKAEGVEFDAVSVIGFCQTALKTIAKD